MRTYRVTFEWTVRAGVPSLQRSFGGVRPSIVIISKNPFRAALTAYTTSSILITHSSITKLFWPLMRVSLYYSTEMSLKSS